MISGLRRVGRNRRGATAVEYGLILALIALSAMGAMQMLAGQTTSLWTNVSDKVRGS